MLHRGIKFVHAAALSFSAVLAFLVVSDLDERGVLGGHAALTVRESDGSASGAQVVRALTDLAAERGVAIGRELPDLEDSEGRRHLYLAVGAPQSAEASWLSEGYPAFSQQIKTDVRPLAELGNRDPRGLYYIFGPHGVEQGIVSEFSSLGLTATITHPFAFSNLATHYKDSVLFNALMITVLAIVALTGASVLLSAKTYGVLRLQGLSYTAIFRRDLWQLGRYSLITLIGITAAVLISLGFYNGLARLMLYATVAAGVAAALASFAIATHAVALRLTFKADILAALKGEMPNRISSFAAYAVRVPVLLLIVGLAAEAATAGQDLLQRQQAWETYQRTGDATGIRITGSLAIDEINKMEKVLGQRLRQADTNGEIIVAGRTSSRNILRGSSASGELLIVNEAFLAEQPVFGLDGQRYLPQNQQGERGSGSKVRLLIPEDLSGETERVRQAAPGILNPPEPDSIKQTDIETHSMKSGQSIFSYTSGDTSNRAEGRQDHSFVENPLILVVPNGSRYLSEVHYFGFATRNQVIFPDPQDVRNILREDARMPTYIAALLPVKQKAAVAIREAAYEFRLHLFNLAAGTAVLLITATGVCIVHARKNAQSIFLQHLSGWRFAAIHRTVLIGEASIVILLALWLPVRTWWDNRAIETYEARDMPTPRPPAELSGIDAGAAAGLGGFTFVFVVCALLFFHRRIVKEGTSEA
ncbi:hypothetical protein [Streptomyces sp. NPDC050428]|uniref:hypothetical protein n=1 Tax=Streptomyces sp. NPDC050428 TaxID=3155757 RepID=UPI00342DFD58